MMGWVGKRAKLVAKDNDPQRVERLARMRWHAERWQAREVRVFADELDIHLWPKVGAAWMPKGSQEEVMTPGQNEKHYLGWCAQSCHRARYAMASAPEKIRCYFVTC